ncbi:MAG TPA: sigma-70 family RNA polymerase sigma factor [Chitinophagaceae bacterium]|nr:sigma-70 family RNA polymerase sigma factor [Chitinophagaceae bacterium]
MHISQKYWAKFKNTKDTKWLARVLDAYKLILFGVAMKYMKNTDEAKDVVQQVFLIALEKLPHTKVDNIGGWLYIVTKNEALAQLKKTNLENGLENIIIEADEINNLDTAIQKNKIDDLLWDAINQLKIDQRYCIIEFYIHDKTYAEIEKEGPYNLKQIKSHIQNGKRNLKLQLMDHPIFQK